MRASLGVDAGPQAGRRRLVRGVAALGGLAWVGGYVAAALAAGASQPSAEVRQLRVDRQADGLYLYATLALVLPAAIEDALLKGVPMFFLAEVDIVRERWYWSDKVVVHAQRHLRLAYHPLTRRWRLNAASGLITPNSMGLALNLSFDSLEDALASMQRLSGWRIGDAGAVDADVAHKLEFRFGLDLAQLPRPFQIGALGQADWNLVAARTQTLPAAVPAATPPAKPGE